MDKKLKKIALCTAIAVIPFQSQALEALDDEFLSDISGQEGITIDTTYKNTIEEFTYVDSDGDGGGTAGKVSLKNIYVGNTLDANFQDNTATTNGMTSHIGQMIDATANGVLITKGEWGTGGNIIINDANQDAELDALGITTDGSGVLSNGVTLLGAGDGSDYGFGIEMGRENGSGQGLIGTWTVVNSTNYLSSRSIAIANARVGAGIDAVQASNKFIHDETLISSKTSGTGVHIVTEEGGTWQAAYFTDTDSSGGNQIGVIDTMQWRLVENDDINDVNAGGTGTILRGARNEFDIDVEGGKLVLSNQVSDRSNMSKVFIGDYQDALTTGAGVVGTFAFLGNHREGTTSIYAH